MLVVGGGFGGVAAALAAVRRGVNVVITEPTRWLGGVLTSQAVPPDEHVWIEQFGSTATYRDFRERIRAYYRAHYPLTARAHANRALNPGAARVSHLCHEPRVALAVLESLLAPHRASGRLRVLLQHEPISASTTGDRVEAVTFRDGTTGRQVTVTAPWFVDATETGDLLPMAGVEHVTGSESQAQTGEPHAPAEARPLNMQPVSVCFALDHLPGADLTIDKPPGYADVAAARPLDWPDGKLSFVTPHPKTRQPLHYRFKPNPDDNPDEIGPDYDDRRAKTIDRNLWTFRRIAARNNFVPGSFASDLTLVNWPQMDYWGGPLFGGSDEEASEHLQGARNLSLSLLYWLQTEAPRPDGGTGWPGLRLRGDVVGDTPDGLAMAPYIRESRRIAAEHTIVEQDIALDVRGQHGAVQHPDSVGIGLYRIDLHPSTGGDPYIDIGCCPYQLPLGALLPVRVENLLPAAKNIGTTHITNGAYRMPLVEWNIGEVVGHLVAFCTENAVSPRAVRQTEDLFAQFSTDLDNAGVERAWPAVKGY
ncbi:FAD dependent oxidoreductase [Kribbella amoyensis]|uniref:FAD dependent oxidoreductase n=2 Tax=Kribbella amoyensis TaxID=996641 RepID=A0A561B2C7_9ACTN|nr:FAD dependent oxidoreductase [Kribbella amoyensis]